MARRDWLLDGLIVLAVLVACFAWSALMQAAFDSNDLAQLVSMLGGLGFGVIGGKFIALRHF